MTTLSGRVDLERLEHAARALFERDAMRAGHVLPSSSSYIWERVRREYVAQARLALEAAGIPVEPPVAGLKIAQPTLDEATVERLFADEDEPAAREVRDRPVSVRINGELDAWLRAEAKRLGCPVSDVVRAALAHAGVLPGEPRDQREGA